MSRRYKLLKDLTYSTPEGSYGKGDEFEADLDAVDEQEKLQSGLLELQPLTYKVVGESSVFGARPGETFTQAMPLGQEELLVQGGHLERVEETPAKRTAKKKEA
jgi:hypothetical protein